MKTKIFNLKTLAWIFAITLTTVFFSCEKDDDPFKECRKHPDCEYFTCKINGKRWEPQCDGGPLFGCTPWDVQYSKNVPGFFASVTNENENQHVYLTVRGKKLQIGSNKLYIDEFVQTRFFDGSNQACSNYLIDTLQNYDLVISRIDSVNNYLSGKFYFTAINKCNEIKTISDGEFNLPYTF